MKKYDKLVRDNIPEIIKKTGGTFKTHFAGKKEYWQKLNEKLEEEVDEFVKRPTKEELADILEVVEAIVHFKGYKASEIKRLRKSKLKKRGGFKKRIILEES